MSKSDKLNNTGIAASRSKSAQKVLDIEERFIDDPTEDQVALKILSRIPVSNNS